MFTNVTYRIKGMLLIGSFVFALLAFLLFGSFFSVNETPGAPLERSRCFTASERRSGS